MIEDKLSVEELYEWIDELHNEINELRSKCLNLFDSISHGDAVHKKWLEKAIDKHFGIKDDKSQD